MSDTDGWFSPATPGNQPMEQFSYDHTLASDPTKVAELQRFMCSFYDQDHIMEDDGPEKYQKMVESAIEANNLAGLEVLWQGVYYYDRDNPDYASALFLCICKGISSDVSTCSLCVSELQHSQ